MLVTVYWLAHTRHQSQVMMKMCYSELIYMGLKKHSHIIEQIQNLKNNFLQRKLCITLCICEFIP